MAKKEKTESKIVLERTYNIPLRRQWLKVPKYKRAKKAVTGVREFLMRHMKAEKENIKLGRYLNLEIWKHGIKNPPHHVKVNVTKDDKGVVKAELFNAPKEPPAPKKKKKAEKKEEKEKKAEKKEEPKKEEKEKKAEEPKKEAEKPKHEEISAEAKKVEAEKLKALRKEHPKQHAPKVGAEPVKGTRVHKVVSTQKEG